MESESARPEMDPIMQPARRPNPLEALFWDEPLQRSAAGKCYPTPRRRQSLRHANAAMYAPIMNKKPASGHSAGARGLGNLKKANRIVRFCFSPQVGEPVWCAKEETKHEAGRLLLRDR